jgi:hypothetical protein
MATVKNAKLAVIYELLNLDQFKETEQRTFDTLDIILERMRK